LFVLLCWAWPSPGLDERPHADPTPLRCKRANAPKAFAGLTHKPHWALCEQEAATPTPPPPVRPDPMPSTNRRPRAIDTSMHYCPHDGCPYRDWLGLGNLRANGHPNGGRGTSGTAPVAGVTCSRPMGPFSMASASRSNSSYASSRAWLKAWVSGGRRGSSKWTPIPCCNGWWRRRSCCGPFRSTSSTMSA